MSSAEYFSDQFAINAYMDASIPVSTAQASADLVAIRAALQHAGVRVVQVPAPQYCQDGVYCANWGLGRGDKFVLSVLPNKRKAEEPYAEKVLQDLGKKIFRAPFPFSGQGDALPCGNLLFIGSTYRTDPRVHQFLADSLGYEVISLQTVPQRDSEGQPTLNAVTGWPDSFFYDLDLALAVLREDLIAWCPEAFTLESQTKLRALPIEKIEVNYEEATQGFACNLVSTGETVVMSAYAPLLRAQIEALGLKTLTPEVKELGKGGGYIRCTTLTLDND